MDVIQRVLNWGYDYKPLVSISISKSAILSNLEEFYKLTKDKKTSPVLKSNAYGHGLAIIAKILDPLNLPFLAADAYFEAITLRKEGIKTPILIIGYSYADTAIKNNLKNISFSVSSLDFLKEISGKAINNINIHLKIDTGMSRQGIMKSEFETATEIINKNKNINLEGIFTHLSDADSPQKEFTEKQIERWNETTDYFKSKFKNIKYFHIGGTSGHIYSKNVYANTLRLGLGLYGIPPSSEIEKELNLKPVLEMKTVISGIKRIKAGDKVGYNGTFTAKKDMLIANLPVGYHEGVDRRLSNLGVVKIKEKFAPIIGKVSMNITTIDISDLSGVIANDEVVVISSNQKDKNSVENIAKICGTIPYEILVHISPNLRRNIIN